MINITTTSMNITWLVEVYKVCQWLILAGKVELVGSSNLRTLLRRVHLFSSNDNQNYYPLLSKYIHALIGSNPSHRPYNLTLYIEIGEQVQIIYTYNRIFKSKSSQINLKNGTCLILESWLRYIFLSFSHS